MEESKCLYDDFYRIRKSIQSAANDELTIQMKYLNDTNHLYTQNNPIKRLLAYRKQVASTYLNIMTSEEEKNILLDLFKKINKEIIDVLGLNY
jgi:hypothetical protein